MKHTHLTLRVSRDLATALARWARARGVPKSEVVREAVARYLAPPADAPGRAVTARELAARWPALPHLSPDEARALSRDLAESRKHLKPVRPAWE